MILATPLARADLTQQARSARSSALLEQLVIKGDTQPRAEKNRKWRGGYE